MSTLTPRSTTITLYQGDDQTALDVLRQKIERLRKDESKGPRLMSEPDPTKELIAEYEALLAEAEERAVKITLSALGRRRWRDLVAAHPPRDGNEGDDKLGVNDETFGDALVSASIGGYKGDVGQLLDSLSDAQFNRLYAEAFTLNRTMGADPKDFLVSTKTQKNAATTK